MTLVSAMSASMMSVKATPRMTFREMESFLAFGVMGAGMDMSRMAEGVGIEPTSPFGLPVFKTGAIDRSAIPPVAVTLAKAMPGGKRNR